MANRQFDLKQEIRIIPAVAVVIAVIAFGGMQYLWHGFLPTQHDPPPLWLRLLLGTFTSFLILLFVLMIGYVNADAKRRRMNRVLWTLLVIFIPNALGFVLYFFVRQPLLTPCPRCSATLEPGYNFCPKCRYELVPMCPECNHPLKQEFDVCPYCGTAAKIPARMA